MTFFLISAFSFGGGYAMIPAIKQQTINAGFLTNKQVSDIIAIAEITPGSFAISSATFAGVINAGVLGGIVATLGIVTPSLIYSTAVAAFYFKFQKSSALKDILKGIRPATIAFITYAVITLAMNSFKIAVVFWEINVSQLDLIAVGIAVFTFVLIKGFKLSPLLCLLVSGVLGAVFYAIF